MLLTIGMQAKEPLCLPYCWGEAVRAFHQVTGRLRVVRIPDPILSSFKSHLTSVQYLNAPVPEGKHFIALSTPRGAIYSQEAQASSSLLVRIILHFSLKVSSGTVTSLKGRGSPTLSLVNVPRQGEELTRPRASQKRVFIRWTEMDYWTTGMEYWTTGMDYFHVIISKASLANKDCC